MRTKRSAIAREIKRYSRFFQNIKAISASAVTRTATFNPTSETSFSGSGANQTAMGATATTVNTASRMPSIHFRILMFVVKYASTSTAKSKGQNINKYRG